MYTHPMVRPTTGDFMHHYWDYIKHMQFCKLYGDPAEAEVVDEVHVILAAGAPQAARRPVPLMVATISVEALVSHGAACAHQSSAAAAMKTKHLVRCQHARSCHQQHLLATVCAGQHVV
jgi:hypothetical protein